MRAETPHPRPAEEGSPLRSQPAAPCAARPALGPRGARRRRPAEPPGSALRNAAATGWTRTRGFSALSASASGGGDLGFSSQHPEPNTLLRVQKYDDSRKKRER